MQQLCGVARAVRGLVADIGLTTFPVTSGSKGLHLYTPFATPVSSQGAVLHANALRSNSNRIFPSW